MIKEILFSKQEKIGILQINRPSANNAINAEIIKIMDTAVDEIVQDKELKVLLIIGNKDFCSGADVAPMVDCHRETAENFIYKNVFFRIKNLEIPTIAAVSGCAFGGGLELALACDLRIAAEDAELALPEVNLGIMPGAGGTVFLPEIVGPAKAKEIILFGSIMSGKDAYNLGIVHKLTTREKLNEDAMAWAKRLSARPINSLKAAKKSINYSISTFDKMDALRYEAKLFSSLFDTYDQTEGMKAYVEKRKPKFLDK